MEKAGVLYNFYQKRNENRDIGAEGGGEQKMDRGNVLVIGNSGVGKSTLINAVLGEEKAKTGYGTSGTTEKLEIYESDRIPFRIIDTIGFEPTFLKEQRAVNAVKKWSKECAKAGRDDHQINVIWFCVEGTSRKLFPKTIQSLSRATSIWKTVPVIVVITKSYSVPERKENIEMVQNAFAAQKNCPKNLKKIIPVVASVYELNETAFAAPEGITELIDATNELMPEGLRAGANDLAEFILNRKRYLAHGIVGAAAASGVVVGAVPIPVADAAILTPIEIAEVNAIARVYGIKNDENTKQFFNSIVEVGTVSTAAKAAIAMLKSIPGINVGASVLNAVTAGCIAAGLGEGTIYIFEQIYLGNKTFKDIDWVTKVLESKMSAEFFENVKTVLNDIGENADSKAIIEHILKIFNLKK